MHVHGNGASQLWRPDIYSTGHFVGVRGKGELLVSLRTEQPEELRPPRPRLGARRPDLQIQAETSPASCTPKANPALAVWIPAINLLI